MVVTGGSTVTNNCINDNSLLIDSVEVLDLASSTSWTNFPSLPKKIRTHFMANLRGSLLTVGGQLVTVDSTARYHNTSLRNEFTFKFEDSGSVGLEKNRCARHSVLPININDLCK